MEVRNRAIKAEHHSHSSTYKKHTSMGLRDQRAQAHTMTTITLKRIRFVNITMSGSNAQQGAVEEVPYVILMRMGNGEIVEVMTIGSTSIEECGGTELVAVGLINPKITNTHKEHFIFEDMLPLVDMREPL